MLPFFVGEATGPADEQTVSGQHDGVVRADDPVDQVVEEPVEIFRGVAHLLPIPSCVPAVSFGRPLSGQPIPAHCARTIGHSTEQAPRGSGVDREAERGPTKASHTCRRIGAPTQSRTQGTVSLYSPALCGCRGGRLPSCGAPPLTTGGGLPRAG